jgi:histone H3
MSSKSAAKSKKAQAEPAPVAKSNKSKKAASKGKKSSAGKKKSPKSPEEGISNPALIRALQRGGVKRASKESISVLREALVTFLTDALRPVLAVTYLSERVTVQSRDVLAATRIGMTPLVSSLSNKKCVNGASKKKGEADVVINDENAGKSKSHKSKSKSKKRSVESSAGKPHRYKAGTVSLRSIRKHQNSDCFLFRRAPFKKLLKSLSFDVKGAAFEALLDKKHGKKNEGAKRDRGEHPLNIHFAIEALNTLQFLAEDWVVKVAINALRAALHANRVTVESKDIRFVLENTPIAMWGSRPTINA